MQQPRRDKIVRPCLTTSKVPTDTLASGMTDNPLLFKCASLALLETNTPTSTIAEKDACVVSRHIWQQWVQNQTAEVLLVEVKQRDQRHVLCVESYHTGRRDLIYVPSSLAIEFDMDEYVEVTLLEEMPPVATKIVLEPLEADSYSFDIAGATSEVLSHWNVLKAGTTLTVPSLEIEGYTMMIHVARTEPADFVLLRGEVPMELVELEQPLQRPPTPIPPLLPILQGTGQEDQEDFNDINDINDFGALVPQQQQQQKSKGFVAFSGQGQRLGS